MPNRLFRLYYYADACVEELLKMRNKNGKMLLA